MKVIDHKSPNKTDLFRYSRTFTIGRKTYAAIGRSKEELEQNFRKLLRHVRKS
jgi:hypothetical protein